MADYQGWRVHARRITTGEWLTHDLPLKQTVTIRELSGPGGVSGVLNPELLHATGNDGRPLLEEWTTALYVEEAGQLRRGGIVQRLERDKAIKTVSAPGFSSYAAGQPYTDTYLPTDFPDPIEVYKYVWTHLQGFPNGNLGLQITGTPSTWLKASSGEGPFKMFWHENRDCGQTLDSIAGAVPFDYYDHVEWTDPSHTDVRHEVQIGFPRLGRRRHDLRFAQDENVTAVSPIITSGEDYANEVHGMGLGDGRGMVRSLASDNDGRLRRARVYEKRAATQGILDRETRKELLRRRLLPDIASLTVKDHPNARVAAITPGDDVLADVDLPWVGRLRVWLRVLAIEESSDAPGVAVLKTQRADVFDYLPEKSPTGEPQYVVL